MDNNFWDFLIDEDNRATLAWLGSGILALLAFFYDRRRRKGKSGESNKEANSIPTASTTVHADNQSVAGGRDVNIAYNNIERKIPWYHYLLLLIVLASFAAAVTAAIQSANALPIHYLTLNCLDENYGDDAFVASDQEVDALFEFTEFLAENDGNTAFVSININANAGAGGCDRDLDLANLADAERDNATGERTYDNPIIVYNRRSNKQKADTWENPISPIWVEGFEIGQFPYGAVSGIWFLPRIEHMNNKVLFQRGAYGGHLTYNGVFSVHYLSGTGYEGGYIEPVENSEKYWHFLKCSRMYERSMIDSISNFCFGY